MERQGQFLFLWLHKTGTIDLEAVEMLVRLSGKFEDYWASRSAAA